MRQKQLEHSCNQFLSTFKNFDKFGLFYNLSLKAKLVLSNSRPISKFIFYMWHLKQAPHDKEWTLKPFLHNTNAFQYMLATPLFSQGCIQNTCFGFFNKLFLKNKTSNQNLIFAPKTISNHCGKQCFSVF